MRGKAATVTDPPLGAINQVLTVVRVPSSARAAQWAGCFFL